MNGEVRPARAKATGNPQGQWTKSDLDYATEMANTLKSGESGYFDLPESSQSIVHMRCYYTISDSNVDQE